MTTPRRRGKQIPQGPKLTANISKASRVFDPGTGQKLPMSDARAVRMKTILNNPQALKQVLIKGVYRG